MLLPRNIQIAPRLLVRLIPGCLYRQQYATLHKSVIQFASQKSNLESPDMDTPVQFSTSKAKDWRSVDTFAPPAKYREAPWYQPISIILSVTIFMIYFCVLREENDMDEELDKTLYERMPGLEEKQLRLIIKQELEHGRDTSQLQARLKEIISEKSAAK